MIQNTILPDDPRLTAYALDEMEAAERLEFEKQLQQDAAARQTVAEIRTTVVSLTNALADEPIATPAATTASADEGATAHAAIIPGRNFRRLDGGPLVAEGMLGKKIKFPHFYYVVSGLAAACFAVFFVYWQRTAPVHESKKYIEVPLTDANSTEEAGQSVSPFSVDADHASYASVRRFIQEGRRPPVDAVKIEELVNYFPYDYAGPERVGSKGELNTPPIAAHLEVASAPWAPEHRLVRIGLKGREVSDATPATGGTLVTIAKDVKLQVKFNPAVVQAYRLIGYENRLPAKEDSNDDKIDAGEIGAGRIVTALYEVVPVGIEMPGETGVDVGPLKYQKTTVDHSAAKAGNPESTQMLTLQIHYKDPAGEVSNQLEFPLYDQGTRFADATEDFKFASSVAAFGMILRDSPYKGSAKLADITAWGRAGMGRDSGGYRNEFLGLVERSKGLLQ
ncbi:MAG TPA: von Willebrand factor type A domain-containing protein [Lacunisphaera sp.]